MNEHHTLLILIIIFALLMIILVEDTTYYEHSNFKGKQVTLNPVNVPTIITLHNVYVDVDGTVREL